MTIDGVRDIPLCEIVAGKKKSPVLPPRSSSKTTDVFDP